MGVSMRRLPTVSTKRAHNSQTSFLSLLLVVRGHKASVSPAWLPCSPGYF